ncbi:hypothetical protein [Undibacterium sp. Di24W]|uniref:hypothetical protein n=1 Tax=Undibacterium sp. Di24W TaxID=3413033 RepID=UPI003BF5DF70
MMKPVQKFIPAIFVLFLFGAFVWHGPIAQLSDYHAFADQTILGVIPHAIDVLSNLAFVGVGLFGLSIALSNFPLADRSMSYWAYWSFFVWILVTSLGSAFYHWAPDDQRLFWDRLPIALACASLLAAVRADLVPGMSRRTALLELSIFLGCAIFSVGWWQQTADLRWYLLLQISTLCLIPIWQFVYAAPMRQRRLFGGAIMLYVLAKICECLDHTILLHLGLISGHSLKHILAALAAAWIAWSWRKVHRIT